MINIIFLGRLGRYMGDGSTQTSPPREGGRGLCWNSQSNNTYLCSYKLKMIYYNCLVLSSHHCLKYFHHLKK